MKKIFGTLFVVLFSTTVYSQVGDVRRDFSIGGSAGYSFNKISFSPSIKQTYKQAPNFGFAARYICEKYFNSICGLQAEVNYVNLGWQELIEDGTNNTYSRSLNYIQVPLLMQMGWGREKRGFKFIFEAGPQFGYYLGGSESMGGDPWDISHRPNNVTFQYGKEPDSRFDYGIAAGLGVELSTPVGHFLVGARYYYGLGDVFDNSKAGYFGRSAHGTISAKVTYLFDILTTKE